MQQKTHYSNGQIISTQEGHVLTFFYKNGVIKAKGAYINNLMEDEWLFYRENGDLWQIGHFKNNMKHGNFTRYDRNGNIEYNENFLENKKVKKT